MTAALSLAVLGLASVAVGQCDYTVLHNLPSGPICGPFAYTPNIEAIANDGSVCGGANAGLCTELPFVWHPGDATLTFLPLPPGMVRGRALDLNESGVVVGYCMRSHDGGQRPCAWTAAGATLLAIPPQATDGIAMSVNSSSSIVGSWVNTGTGPTHAARWDGGDFTLTDIHPGAPWSNSRASDISDTNIVVGWVSLGTIVSQRGFVVSGSNLTILPPILGGINSLAVAVNNLGEVAAMGYPAEPGNPGFAKRSFLWRDGTMMLFGQISGLRDSNVYDLNDLSQAVGECGPATPYLGIIWKRGKISSVSVNSNPVTLPITGCNDLGQIVYGRLVLQPVPLPPFDIDQNCSVNVNDLLDVINDWGRTKSPADCTQDGVVDLLDLVLVLINWG